MSVRDGEIGRAFLTGTVTSNISGAERSALESCGVGVRDGSANSAAGEERYHSEKALELHVCGFGRLCKMVVEMRCG